MDMKSDELRTIMHNEIDKYGIHSKEVVIASQNLDPYINKEQLKICQNGQV